MCWADPLHQGRSLDQWSQRSAEDHQVDANQDQQNGNDHPSYVRQKFRNDVVDEHVAMRLVLRDLQPEHLTSDIDRHTGTEYAGLPDIAFEVSRLATPWIALEQWLIVFATRKQNLPGFHHDGKAVPVVTPAHPDSGVQTCGARRRSRSTRVWTTAQCPCPGGTDNRPARCAQECACTARTRRARNAR